MIRRERVAAILAALARQIAPSNKTRHETLQRLMRLNDLAIIAMGAPIYLTPDQSSSELPASFTLVRN